MKRIAIVEDNADNRLLLQAILGEQYEVMEYKDGMSALDGIKASAPDLVLMDISLPGLDGQDVLHRLRDDPDLRTLPVIALTAHAMRGDRERFLATGFDDYVTKPVTDEAMLLQAIDRLLTISGTDG